MNKLLLPILLTTLLVFVTSAQQVEDREPELLSVPKVALPKEPKEKGLAGKVVATVLVDATGKVTAVNNVSGPGWICPAVNTPAISAIRRAASDAATKAKFSPAIRNGAAVASSANVHFEFNAPASKDVPATGEMRLTRLAAVQDGAMVIGNDGKPTRGVLEQKAISLPKPPYPPAARAVRAAGLVQVQVLIYEDGSIYSAEPISGHPLLQKVARTAACGAKFTQTLLEGKPVKVSGLITYNFAP